MDEGAGIRLLAHRRRGADPACHPRLIRAGCLTLLIAVLLATPGHRAATPGLPFTEDLADTSVRDDPQTTADRSTGARALRLARPGKRFSAFGPGVAGRNITAAAHQTWAVALGDVDGTGGPPPAGPASASILVIDDEPQMRGFPGSPAPFRHPMSNPRLTE